MSETTVVERRAPAALADLLPNGHEWSPSLRQAVEAVGVIELCVHETVHPGGPSEGSAGLISIVVPTYNVEAFIVPTLASIVQQTYRPLEIVVVDDGSVDSTAEAVLGFMATRSGGRPIRFVRLPHLGNPALLRNFALYNLVSGQADYIGFMDGDDLYAGPAVIRTLVDALEAHPGAFAAYGGYAVLSENGRRLRPPRMLERSGDGYAWKPAWRLTWENLAAFNLEPFHLQTLIVRRGGPYLPYSVVGEDAGYYARLFHRSAHTYGGTLRGIVQVPIVAAHYRKRSRGISGSRPMGRAVPQTTGPGRGDPVPPFYALAGIPKQFITPDNISRWAVKRWCRLCYRALARRQLRAALGYLRCALRDRRIKRSHLLVVPLRELLDEVRLHSASSVRLAERPDP